MNDKRQQIFNWQQQGLIDDQDIDKALSITEAQPNGHQWYDFIKKSVLYMGVLAMAFGVIFFFAYNWANFSTFHKFALVQLLMISGLVVYTQTPHNSYINTAVLLFLVLLIGALFALFGQTYQTGKDPWQLFAMWALFTTPLAYQSKNTIIWLTWLGLINLSMVLFVNVNNSLFGLIFEKENFLLLFVFVNILIMIICELLFRYRALFNRVTAQCAAAIVMIASTSMAAYAIMEVNFNGMYLFIYAAWMSCVYYFYRYKSIDLMILSSAVISAICTVVVLFTKVMDNLMGSGIYLMSSLLIIGFSTIGIKWLISVSQQTHNSEVMS